MVNNIVMLGLDGADFERVSKWIEEGELPNFQEIKESGFFNTLRSPIPANTGPSMGSFFSGQSLSRIGRIGFFKPDGELLNYRDIRNNVFWEIEEMPRSFICNLPTTYPPIISDGVMISGDRLTPSEASNYCYPKTLKKEVKGFHSRIDDLVKLSQEDDLDSVKYLSLAKKIVDERYKRFKKIYNKYSFPFSIFWVGTTDSIQHHLWREEEKIKSLFRYIDQNIIKELREEEKTNLLIFSDHGFTSKPPEYRFYINNWLEEKGFLKYRTELNILRKLGLAKKGKNFYRRFKSLKNRLGKNKSTNSQAETVRKSNKQYWFGTPPKAFREATAVGFRRFGVKFPDKERKNEVIGEIVNKLLNTRYRGKNVFNNIWQKEEIYGEGKYFEILPELVYSLNEEFISTTSPETSKIFEKERERETPDHTWRRRGILMGEGPNIKKLDKKDNSKMRDLAPTILNYFGELIPNEMDGSELDIWSTKN